MTRKKLLFACYHFHLDPSNVAIQLGQNSVYNGGGLRCFPEQSEPGPNADIHNKILTQVTLAAAIPSGMTGTVFVDWFDPDNPRGSTITPDHNGPGKRENHGNMVIDGEVINVVGGVPVRKGAELTFAGGTQQQQKICTIDPAHAGDNYIIAAHPNEGIVDNYRLQSDGKTLYRPSPNGMIPLEASLQTPMLTVWRMLWIEFDRMYKPKGKDPQGNYLPFEPGVDQLAKAFPPGIIAPGSHIATELARACIVPEEFMANTVVEVPGPLKVEENEFISVRNVINHEPYRSVKNNYETFWTLQVVSAFESWGIYGVNRGNITFMFNTNIEAGYNAEGLTVGLNKIFSIVLLHEIGHALWLEDALDKNDLTAQPVAGVTYGVMLNKGPLRGHLVNDNDIFTIENIRTIQAMGESNEDAQGKGYNRPR